MTTFALIHGAWGTGWHWGTVPGELQRLGHEVVAPDLPCEDPTATFDDYAGVILAALEDGRGDDVVVVGYSLGGHTAALVAARRPVRALVYLAALVPEPGVSLNEQFAWGENMLLPDYTAGIENTGALSRWVDFDVYHCVGCHDCPEPVARERFARSRGQCRALYRKPCSLTAVPDVPTRFILCSEDRLMNNALLEPAVRERVDSDPVELAASHSPMASRPVELARLLSATGRS
ncbi:MAG TPA: alpha/beta hydrolase [Solirubrobacteraceae bacterium]|nr:alpha/beta hydrolase [Solirubrobacteraceae bacterium]